MKRIFAGLFLLAAFVGSPAFAGKDEMAVSGYEKVVMSDGESPTAARVKAAILDAARQRRWEVVAVELGKVTLRYAPRGDFELVIAVRYDDNGFKIEYVSSENLDYEAKRGKVYIHRKYNMWVANLTNDIRLSRVFVAGSAGGEGKE